MREFRQAHCEGDSNRIGRRGRRRQQLLGCGGQYDGSTMAVHSPRAPTADWWDALLLLTSPVGVAAVRERPSSRRATLGSMICGGTSRAAPLWRRGLCQSSPLLAIQVTPHHALAAPGRHSWLPSCLRTSHPAQNLSGSSRPRRNTDPPVRAPENSDAWTLLPPG